MNKTKIYFNPNCSKSKEVLNILLINNINPIVRDYINDGISELEIKIILNKVKVSEIVRINEPEFINNPFDLSDKKVVIKSLIDKPILLQRPIVIHNDEILICRPPQIVLSCIEN